LRTFPNDEGFRNKSNKVQRYHCPKKRRSEKTKTKLDKAEAEVTVIKRDHEKRLNNPKKRKHIEAINI
jgi:hypothetical protein